MAKDDVLYVRISTVDLEAFKKKCVSMDREHPDVAREMITAFTEGRLKITPTDGQKLNEEMYNVD